MIQQKKINVERILRVNRVGAWRIEIEDGKITEILCRCGDG